MVRARRLTVRWDIIALYQCFPLKTSEHPCKGESYQCREKECADQIGNRREDDQRDFPDDDEEEYSLGNG